MFNKIQMIAFMCFFTINSANADNSGFAGSSFNEVWTVVRDQKLPSLKTEEEIQEFSVYQLGHLPQYPVSTCSIFKNGDTDLKRDAVRTTSQRFDYYDRLPKKLHPNGVCVAGQWKIDRETPYSGMLSSNANGLFIGRISVAMEDTTNDDDRGFGFAGKIFPTMNSDQKVMTGNFFSVDVLMGTDLKHVLDARTTNEPDVGFNLSLIGLGLRIGSALSSADQNPGFRPLTQVASAGNGNSTPVLQPKWIRIRADKNLIHNNEADFRNEILQAMKDNVQLTYYIDVSNSTHDRNDLSGWSQIGHITLNQAIVSYGCDRRLHFAHPRLK